jgi:hypothetical protein
MSSVDTRPPHGEKLVHSDPTPALQTREDPDAHARPHRDASRRITPGHFDTAPRGTALAAYPSQGRVRAMTSVRGRTRTGRIWFRRTSPFETRCENPSTHANAGRPLPARRKTVSQVGSLGERCAQVKPSAWCCHCFQVISMDEHVAISRGRYHKFVSNVRGDSR